LQHLPKLSFNANTTTGYPGAPIPFAFTNQSHVPAFEKGRGIIIAMMADAPGAPTLDSVIAGPLILFQQPGSLMALTAQ